MSCARSASAAHAPGRLAQGGGVRSQSNDAAENGAHAGRGLACDEGPRKWASSIESCLFISRSSTGVLSESVEDKGDLIMNNKEIKSEVISRRSALSLLGLAALGLALPTSVLTVSDAEAQQPAAPTAPGAAPAATPMTGTERRQARRTRRVYRRKARRKGREERRELRRTGSEEKK
jgi:hypothetical protein